MCLGGGRVLAGKKSRLRHDWIVDFDSNFFKISFADYYSYQKPKDYGILPKRLVPTTGGNEALATLAIGGYS